MSDAKKDEEPAAEEGAEGAPAEGEEGKKGKKKLILFIAAPLLLLIIAGAGLYFTGMLDGLLGKGEATEGGEEAGAEGHGAEGDHGKEAKGDHGKDAKGGHGGAEPREGAHGTKITGGGGAYFLQIPNMLVNLSTTEGPPRYLRLSVQLELATDADTRAVEAVMPRVVDEFQTYLRELRVKDLRGSAGIYRLQMELLSRVNAAAYPVEVKDVLFQEILIQ